MTVSFEDERQRKRQIQIQIHELFVVAARIERRHEWAERRYTKKETLLS